MGQSLRNRPVDIGRARARFLIQRFGRDLRAARLAAGLTQRRAAKLAGLSQAIVSQTERGLTMPGIETSARLAASVGGEVSLVLYPGRGVSLRDSGQLRLAEMVGAHLPRRAQVQYEVPVGEPPDQRAADMVVDVGAQLQMLEIERLIADYQAQYRAAQLKRAALEKRAGKPVRLVWVVSDTRRNRRVLAEHGYVVTNAFTLSHRETWAALAAGTPLRADGMVWLRERHDR